MEKRKNVKVIVSVIILAVAMIVLFSIYKIFMPGSVEGNKKIIVTVVHKDKSEKEFIYQTDEEYLAQVITSDGLVSGEEGPYGLFITTVDKETADDSNEEWWCITKGGENVNTSASETVIENGDEFELTLMEGY